MRLAVFVLLFAASAVHAEPWDEGVDKQTQDTAFERYKEGNQLFGQEAHKPALEKYMQAIALWDHPLIRFNMAVTLVRLDRFLEAAESMDRALRFGKGPFPTPEMYRQAVDYQKLIAGRVGEIEATCTQANVQVTLDGKQWLTCPGTQKKRVLTGEHTIVAEAKDFLTKSHRLVVTGGATVRAKVELERFDASVKYEYPTRRWIPWSVAAGGTAIAITGIAVWFSGSSQMDDFKENFARDCPTGCDLDDEPALRDQRDSAQFKGTLGTSLMIAGGAVAAGGVVWALVFNRPQRVLPVIEASPTGASVSASWSF